MAFNNNIVPLGEAGEEKFYGPRQHVFSTNVATHEIARPSHRAEHIAAIHEQSLHRSCRIQAHCQQLEILKEAQLRVSCQHLLEAEQQKYTETAQLYINLYREYETLCGQEIRWKQEADQLERLLGMQKVVIQQQDDLLASYESCDATLFDTPSAGQYQAPSDSEYIYDHAASYNSVDDTVSEGQSESFDDVKTDNEPQLAEEVGKQTSDHELKERWLPVEELPDPELSGTDFSLGAPLVPLSPTMETAKMSTTVDLNSESLTRSISPPSQVQSSLMVREEKRPVGGESQAARKRRDRRHKDFESDALQAQ